MPALSCIIIPALKDNYIYLLHDNTGWAAVIDPGEPEPVLAALHQHNLTLAYILNTHHHWDHTDGNLALKHETGCQIVGFAEDKARIPGIDIALNDGDRFTFTSHHCTITHVPGHTLGAIMYHFAKEKMVFTGDTLFSLGCGRLFEGTPAMMHASLQKIAALPDDTLLYCGHEYTVSNAEFALTLEPDNIALQQRYDQARTLRAQNQPTLPITLAEERATNPFLRTDSPAIQHALGLEGADPVTIFTALRQRKDSF